MGELRSWGVDKLVATRILGRLDVEATPALVEEVAAELAEHRKDVEQWVADRVRSRTVKILEDRSIEVFGQMEEDWTNGFRAAEELVARLSPDQLLDQPSGKAPSKGQVLRSMVKTARKRSALVEKRPR